MGKLRYRFVRCLAGSVAKWTWMELGQLTKLKGNKFKATIGKTKSECWRVTDLAPLEVDEWLLPYVIENSNIHLPDVYTSTDVENA